MANYGNFNVEYTGFVAGINEGVFLKSISLTEVDWSNYKGSAIDVVFGKEDKEIKRTLIPVQEENVRQGKFKTMQEAIDSAYSNFNEYFKSILLNYCTEEQWKEAHANVDNFEAFAEACINLLPEGYDEKLGRLILSYKPNGYLELPKFLWLTGTFFTLDTTKVLKVSNRIVMERPVVESVAEGSQEQDEDNDF